MATFRSAAGALFNPRTAATAARAQVVASDGVVLGVIERTGANRMLVRTAGGGVDVIAVREGARVTYRVQGQSVGFSELRNGRIHHYVRNGSSDEFIGHDVVRRGRLYQYDADGLLMTDTALAALHANTGAAAAAGLGLLAFAASAEDTAELRREKRAEIVEQVRALRQEIQSFASGRREP